MELQSYLAIFWRRKWIILATTLISLIGVAGLTLIATPIYVSSTTLRVATVGANTLGGGKPDIEYTLRLMNTYANIVNSRSTRAELTTRLDLKERPTLSVNIVPGTELMKIESEATDPNLARDVAAAAAEIVIRQSHEQFRGGGETTQEILARQLAQIQTELEDARKEYDDLLAKTPNNTGDLNAASQSIQLKERTYATLLDQYESARLQEALRANSVYIVEPAEAASSPAKPRVEVNLAIGVLLGLILGVVLAFLFDALDSTLYTPGQIEAITKLPTVGHIPVVNGRSAMVEVNGNGAISHLQPHTEAFRRLRVNLLSTVNHEPAQSILITSADDGEGKSTITSNLAIAMAKSGRSVVVVDCDLHLPTMHTVFKLPNDFGLTSVLTKQVSVSGTIQKSAIPNIHVITSGPALLDPLHSPELRQISPSTMVGRLEQGTELLGTPEMGQLLEQLTHQFDVVLVDTPALLAVTDAAVLAPLVDTVVLVVASERSHRDSLRAVLELLDSVKVKSLNIVINRERQKAKHYGYNNKGRTKTLTK